MSSTDWSVLIAALAALIMAASVWVRSNATARAKVIEKQGDAEVKKTEAETAKLGAETEALIARADVLRLEAEAKKIAEENTGRFLTMASGDRTQAAEFYKHLQHRIDALEAEVQKLQTALRDEQTARKLAEEERDNIDRSREALWEELEKWTLSHKSGGAYPPPSEMPPRRRITGGVVAELRKKDG